MFCVLIFFRSTGFGSDAFNDSVDHVLSTAVMEFPLIYDAFEVHLPPQDVHPKYTTPFFTLKTNYGFEEYLISTINLKLCP